MDRMNIKAVIFDLGNVLLDFNHMLAAGRISRFSAFTPEEIFELFFDSPITGLFEEGKISPQEFFLRVKEKLNLKLGFKEFLPIWNEIFFFSQKNRQVYHLAKSLKPHLKTALVSNSNILHYEYVLKEFPVFDAFDKVILSCEEGVRKPHPLIYENTLKALAVPPAEVFYTDDRLELIEGARILGIRAFQFINAEQLNKDLLSCGITRASNAPILSSEE